MQPIEIDGPGGRTIKAKWLREARRKQKIARLLERRKKTKRTAKIAETLEEARTAKRSSWLNLWRQLRLEGEPQQARGWIPITQWPGWARLTYNQRQVCRRSARTYLLEHAHEAVNYSTNSYGSYAGTAALWLWFDDVERDEKLRSVLAGPWLKTLALPCSSDDEPAQWIFSLLYRLNPPVATEVWLESAAKDAAATHRHIFAFRFARYCWNKALSAAAEKFLGNLVDPRSITSGIEEWMELDRDAASRFALNYLQKCAPTADAYPIGLFKTIVIGVFLVFGGPNGQWLAQIVGYPIVAGVSCIVLAIWLRNRGVCGSDLWTWPVPEGVRLRPGLGVMLLLGLIGGGFLGIGLWGYEVCLSWFFPGQKLLGVYDVPVSYVAGMVFLAVVCAPLAEEFLFRGLLYRTLDVEVGDGVRSCSAGSILRSTTL